MEKWETRSTLSVEEAGQVLGIGRHSAYAQARRYLETKGAEGLPVIKFGRLLRVPVPKLREFLGARETTAL